MAKGVKRGAPSQSRVWEGSAVCVSSSLIHFSDNYSSLITNRMMLALAQPGRREGGSVCEEEKMNLPALVGGEMGVNGVYYPCALSRDDGAALIFC